MTECPKCNGRGTVGYFHIDHFVDIECDRCHGSGEVSEVEMTNEEWFASLPTEEKAEWLTNHSKFIYECGQKQVAPKTMYEEDWEWWLKQPHTPKE